MNFELSGFKKNSPRDSFWAEFGNSPVALSLRAIRSHGFEVLEIDIKLV